MHAELFLTLLIPAFPLICSIPLNEPKTNGNCTVKDGDRFPTFLYLDNGQYTKLLCSNVTCQCDGTNTGYKDCQSCCCTIRERIHASLIVSNREVQSVQKEEKGDEILVWAIMATVAFVLVILIAVRAYCYQKRQADEYRQKIAKLTGSLESLTKGRSTELNELSNDVIENTTIVQVPETVFFPVETVEREENNNQVSQMQSSSNETENIMSSTNDHVDNPTDYNITQEVNHDITDDEATTISSSQ